MLLQQACVYQLQPWETQLVSKVKSKSMVSATALMNQIKIAIIEVVVVAAVIVLVV